MSWELGASKSEMDTANGVTNSIRAQNVQKT